MISISDVPKAELQKFILSNKYVTNELESLGINKLSYAFGCDDEFHSEIIKCYSRRDYINCEYVRNNLGKFGISLNDFDTLKVVMCLCGVVSSIDMLLDALYKMSTNHQDYIDFKSSLTKGVD